MNLFVIITSYKEEATIGKAVEQIICPNRDLWSQLRLIITSPDQDTLKKAEEVCQTYGFVNFRLLQDLGQGKASALNLAVETITKEYSINPKEDLLILTDGDMYIAEDAINHLLGRFSSAQNPRSEQNPSVCKKPKSLTNTDKSIFNVDTGDQADPNAKMLSGVGGHPVSLDSRTTMFGYFSHLFCEAAHKRRLHNDSLFCNVKSDKHDDNAYFGSQNFIPMSGYLYAFSLVDGLFPIPPQVRAEDAYISQKLLPLGYSYGYAPKALAYVKFPKNLSDWYKQKTRSLGGNVQLKSLRESTSDVSASVEDSMRCFKSRSILQDLEMVFFPLTFAKTPKEFLWSLLLYPLRLFLWLKIYFNHAFNRYKSGMWERIESSK